ncbi:MAG TPA: hypothetical protein VH413_08830 [Verrucomicrobiae bacterium]|jgi:hypothetical protein|nr:hypothetical protein [Verrucomicrobiae bacterium]
MYNQKYLIRILLPLCNKSGRVFPAALYQSVKANLSSRFQNFTTYSRAAAEKPSSPDNLVAYEVTAESPDIKWLREYRNGLKKIFQEHAIVIHAQKIVLP